MTTQETIEQLVQKAAQKALEDGSSLAEMLNTLKNIAPYYTLIVKGKARPDDNEETTMDDITARLRVVEENDDGGDTARAVPVGNRRGRQA